MQTVQRDCLFLYLVGVVGFFSSTIFLLRNLVSLEKGYSDADILLKYCAADLLVSALSFLSAFHMDVTSTVTRLAEHLCEGRPQAIKPLLSPGEVRDGVAVAVSGGWVLDMNRARRNLTFLGELELTTAVDGAAERERERGCLVQFCLWWSGFCGWDRGDAAPDGLHRNPLADPSTATPPPARPGRARKLNPHWLRDSSSSENSPSPLHRREGNGRLHEAENGPIML